LTEPPSVPQWYETFFDALAFDVWRSLVPGEVSGAEASFLLRRLAADGGRRHLLDVPCGDGRLALRVAAAGHAVVGVDLSPVAIERLTDASPGLTTPSMHPVVTARRGDMRDLAPALEGLPPFDGAWCMGNSFGYLDTAGTAAFLHGVAAALRPGARFVVDAAIAAESVLPHLGTHDRYERDGATLVMDNAYEPRTSTMVTDMTLEAGGRRARRVVRHRVMTCREIVEALEGAGLAVDDLCGGLDGEPYAMGSSRCLVVATRR
jgi:SAM-dependent methyltransferase